MADKSGIEWTDATWNPLAGCTPVSEGCRHCYAASMAIRLEGMGQVKYKGTAKKASDGRAVFTGKINLDIASLQKPLEWKTPRRIFVNSMSDLFHENVPDDYISAVFSTMRAAHWHTFQVLTKRPERMATWTKAYYGDTVPLPNVWLGTSVENQEAADTRVHHLLRAPATIRFLSCEPLLGRVRLPRYLMHPVAMCDCHRSRYKMEGYPTLEPDFTKHMGCPECGKPYTTITGIHWVIAGGESGHKARPLHPDWIRELRDHCQATGTAFHFKQWGEWLPVAAPHQNYKGKRLLIHTDGTIKEASLAEMIWAEVIGSYGEWQLLEKQGKHKAGRLLDGRTWDEFPVVPLEMAV